ncbi:hypothetical protein ACHAXT_011174 [Thalassiosira profunda]
MAAALPALAPSGGPGAPLTESQSRIAALTKALAAMDSTTKSACRTCTGLSHRSRHLDSLTSPASETSALLAQTSANLTLASGVLKDAREKFDTVGDCAPAVERLFWGARGACREVAAHAERQGRGGVLPPGMKGLLERGGQDGLRDSLTKSSGMDDAALSAPLTEQELYAGADALEIVRDAHAYFAQRPEWKSASDAGGELERVHCLGVDAMGLLVTGHLTGAGAAVRRKVDGAATVEKRRGKKASRGQRASTAAERAEEAAAQTRDRLQEALQNRDLMKSIGEYEEYLPLSTRVVRELRAIFECLGGMPSDGEGLVLSSAAPVPNLPPPAPALPPGGKVLRTEKVGSGHYTNLAMADLRTGYPHLDAYGEARKSVAYASVDGYCRQLRNARKKLLSAAAGGAAAAHAQNVDAAARDAVRCIEHAMVVVSGEKSVHRCVVAPSSSAGRTGGEEGATPDPRYRLALAASYSYVAGAAVDRLLDLIEYTFLREAGAARPGPGAPLTESQSRIAALTKALAAMDSTTKSACRTCTGLSHRSRHLDSLTSPASETSALLAQTSANLTLASGVLKDAREKFDTVGDCEPAVERLFWGARGACREVAAHAERQGRGGVLPPGMKDLLERGGQDGLRGSLPKATGMDDAALSAPLTEQELYAGADALEIVRDAHSYFAQRPEWKSASDAGGELERVHCLGVDAMGLLVTGHLTGAGAAVRRKVDGAATVEKRREKKASRGQRAATAAERAEEAAAQTRDRLQEALQNRDLMKSIGEYEEYLPLSTRVVRELRAIFECLGGMPSDGEGLALSSAAPLPNLPPPAPALPPGGKVLRTEKVGSGHYTNLTLADLRTGYPHLDAYGEARKSVAYASVDGYCRQLRTARKKASSAPAGGAAAAHAQNVDAAARDAVRCIEHAMVVVSGEKSVHRCVVAPSSAAGRTGGEEGATPDPRYRLALAASYSHVAGAAVDRLLDLIEYTFLREAGCASNLGSAAGEGGAAGSGSDVDIRSAAAAAAAGLRVVDGVRMLGPSLSKLCELSALPGDPPPPPGADATVASALCISLHRSTVKNCSKTLENLARAIQLDPLDGPKHRPTDARVATVSSDVVHAIRMVSPFVSAYKSVSKRRALPWDPNIGNGAAEMDAFVRFLVKQLLISLGGKAQNYKNDEGPDAQAKSHLFMMNNTHYLLDLLAPTGDFGGSAGDGENYRINAPWFWQKLTKTFEGEKGKYLAYWDVLNRHLTDVDDRDLTFQGNKDVLSLESGRLLKSRFSGFIEDFERVYSAHRTFTVIDPKLRGVLQSDVRKVFLGRYKRFFERYSRINFSKKNQEQYLKYPPQKLDSLIGQLFAMQ